MMRAFLNCCAVGLVVLVFSITAQGCGNGASRITPVDTDARVQTAGSEGFRSENEGIVATHLASVLAPEVGTEKIPAQATSFAFSNNFAFVSYNTAGETLAGGIEGFDLSTPKRPVLFFSDLSKEKEISDLQVRDDLLVAVGVNSLGGALFVYDLANEKKPRLLSTLQFEGFVGTSVFLESEVAYVTVGDNLGYVEVGLSNPREPEILKALSLENALFVFRRASSSYVLAGADTLGIYLATNDSVTQLFDITAGRQEAPIRGLETNGFLLVNPNQDGFKVIDLRDPNDIRLTHEVDVEGNGNGIALFDEFAFLAQGEAGVKILDIQSLETAAPRVVGTLDFENDPGSANQVRAGGSDPAEPLVFIADGRGGFQIMQFFRAVRLEASKFYSPTSFQDGALSLASGEVSYRIPKEVPVVAGNAGNHWVDLYFDDLRCRYRGGSDQSRPNPGTAQWNKGLSYNIFLECSDGRSKPGDWINASREIRLSVANGHAGYSPTTVEVFLGTR